MMEGEDMRRQTVIELRDRDGVMPYNAETFARAIKGTREYLRHLLAHYPADMPMAEVIDTEISLRSTAAAFEPLDWLLEESVMTDRQEGGAT